MEYADINRGSVQKVEDLKNGLKHLGWFVEFVKCCVILDGSDYVGYVNARGTLQGTINPSNGLLFLDQPEFINLLPKPNSLYHWHLSLNHKNPDEILQMVNKTEPDLANFQPNQHLRSSQTKNLP